MKKEDWFSVSNVAVIDSPALLVYRDRVKENIRELIRVAGGADRLSPHVKTHKMSAIIAMQKEVGITHFKCATIAEAEMLGASEVDSVLLAYQLNSTKALRFIEVQKRFPKTHYASLNDNIESAKMIDSLYGNERMQGVVYLDIDNGMHRTGIAPGEDAIQLYQVINRMNNVTCVGFHVYDGHINEPDFELRKKHCDKDFKPVNEMVALMLKQGIEQPKIIAGGSPTLPIHAKDDRVLCSPGTNILWDKGYSDLLSEQHFLYAGILLTRIISKPVAGVITTDLGYKSIAAENPIDKRIYFLNLDDYQVVSQSEEHLEVRVNEHKWKELKIGDVLYGVPHHICPTVASYGEVQVVEGGIAVNKWKVDARNKKVSI